MAEAWTVSRTANGINVIDENGLPVCTRVGLDDAKLIASAPRLAEQVRILRKAMTSIYKGSKKNGRWLDGNGTECNEDDPGAEWEFYSAEEQRVWMESICDQAFAALEATKEGT